MVIFLNQQLAAVQNTQKTVRIIHAELTRLEPKFEEMTKTRELLIVEMNKLEEDRKVHRSILDGLFEKLKRLKTRPVPTWLHTNPEFLELLVAQYLKFLHHFHRCEASLQTINSYLLSLEQLAKTTLNSLDFLSKKLTSATSDFLLTKISTEEHIDKIEIPESEEFLVEKWTKVSEEMEIEVEIVGKAIGKFSEISVNGYEEVNGIRKVGVWEGNVERKLVKKGGKLEIKLKTCEVVSDERLKEKINAFSSLLTQS